MSVFIPYTQRKTHVELKPGDFVRIQGDFFEIDEVRKFRRPFDDITTPLVGSQTVQCIALTGSLKSRFQHIDKFAIDAALATVVCSILYRNTDVTGLQYAHSWNINNANLLAPTELGINSFSREDLITVVVTTPNVTDEYYLWFSGEEYTLVDYPKTGGPASDGIPARFVLIAPYGFSRVMSKEEFETAQMAQKLRT